MTYPRDLFPAATPETTWDASVPPEWSCGCYVWQDLETFPMPVTETTLFAIPKWLRSEDHGAPDGHPAPTHVGGAG